MNAPIRVMICDDSAVMRRLIATVLKTDPEIKVVAEAKHGQDALDRLYDVRPDVLVMDVEMPVMDGIDTVREIRRRTAKLPIIMFSSLTSRGAEATLDAINAGANDFATKPAGAGHINQAMAHVKADLLPKIRQWAGRAVYPQASPMSGRSGQQTGRKLPNVPPPSTPTPAPSAARRPLLAETAITSAASSQPSGPVSVIAIGVSTGGPEALSTIVNDLPKDLPVPILIAQHMPPVFTGLLADRLAAQNGHRVREATDGESVTAGDILVAPGDYHMTVVRDKLTVRVKLNQDPPENSCRPAVDPLFRSVAACYGARALGVVLTGMGKDGEQGAVALRQMGGRVVAQDEATSVVWGMPGAIARSGLADRILPLQSIANEMMRNAQPTCMTST